MTRVRELNVKEILYLKFRPGILSSCPCEFHLQKSASLLPWAFRFLYSCLLLYKSQALWDRNNYVSFLWPLTSLIATSIKLPAPNSISGLSTPQTTRFQTLGSDPGSLGWQSSLTFALSPSTGACPAGVWSCDSTCLPLGQLGWAAATPFRGLSQKSCANVGSAVRDLKWPVVSNTCYAVHWNRVGFRVNNSPLAVHFSNKVFICTVQGKLIRLFATVSID